MEELTYKLALEKRAGFQQAGRSGGQGVGLENRGSRKCGGFVGGLGLIIPDAGCYTQWLTSVGREQQRFMRKGIAPSDLCFLPHIEG